MNSPIFKAFVKHASGSEDMPEDYIATKAVVATMFPKMAVSLRWVARHAERGVRARMKKPTEIGFRLLDRAGQHLDEAKNPLNQFTAGAPFSPTHGQKRHILGLTIGDTVRDVAKRKMAGFSPAAVNGLELGGLATLGVSPLKTLRDPNASATEKSHAKYEAAGLGALAVHPAYELGKPLLQRAKAVVKPAASWAARTIHH